MKHPCFRLLFASALLGLVLSLPVATLAQQMNYQGRLTDSAGNPLGDGQYTLTFKIYDAATGGTVLWGPFVVPAADLVNGRFNVILGPLDAAARSLPDAFAGSTGAARFLGIQVDVNAEILPRQQILAAPEALHANVADTVIDGAIGTSQLADGSVTAAKIAGGTAVWLSTGSTIYNLNDVAIGTDVPDQKLHVAGGLRLSGGGIHLDNAANLYAKSSSGVDESFLTGRLANDETLLTYGMGGLRIRNNSNTQLMFMNDGGNVGIGTDNPTAKLNVNGTVAATAVTAGSINGELPPHIIEVGSLGTPGDNSSALIPHDIVSNYLADADGGTIRLLLRVTNSDEVRMIDEHIYIEQTDKSNGINEGRSGYCRQLGGGEQAFVLQNNVLYDIIPNPWGWVWIRNYHSFPVSPAFSDLRLEVLLVPNLTATVIIYDR